MPIRVLRSLAGVWVIAASSIGLAQSRPAPAQPCPPERALIALRDVSTADHAAPASAPAAASTDTQALIEQARTALEDDQLELAERRLTEILARPDGDRFETHYLRGKLRARIGAIDEAIESASKAVGRAPDSADAHLLLAELLAVTSDLDQAARHFRAATLAGQRELNNANVTAAWMRLAETLEVLGYCSAALESFQHFDEALWDTNPEHANAPALKMHLASEPRGGFEHRLTLLKRLGRAGECVRVTRAAFERWPDEPAIARAHATALIDAGRPAEALQLAEAWIARPAGGAAFVPIAIRAASEAGQLDAWLVELVKAIEAGRPPSHAAGVARALRSSGDPKNSVRIGLALIACKQPLDDFAWDVALAQLETGEPSAALATLASMARERPTDEPPPRRIGEWCAAVRKRGGFDELIATERERTGRDFADDFVLGLTAAGLERADLAAELLIQCLKQKPDFSPALGYRGRELLARFDWNGAIQYAEDLLKPNPSLAVAWFIIGQAADGLDDDSRAAEAFKKAIKYAPQNAAYMIAFAHHCRRIDDKVSAQRYFGEAVTVAPENGEAHEGLIGAYLLGDKVPLAREHFERMQRLDLPADTIRRVRNALWEGDSVEARMAELRAQLDVNPGDIETAKLLIALQVSGGERAEASAVCDAALARAPDDYNLLFVRSDIDLADGRFDAALATLDKLANRYPNRGRVLKRLVFACQAEFQLDRSAETLKRLIARDPKKWTDYHGVLLQQYERLGQFDDALALIDGGLTDIPNDSKLRLAKASVLIAADRKPEGVTLLVELLDNVRGDVLVREVLLDAAIAAGGQEAVEQKLRNWLGAVAPNSPEYFEVAGDLVHTLVRARRGDDALKFVKGLQPGGMAEVYRQRMWLGEAQAGAGQLDKAIAEYEALMGENWVRPEKRIDLQLLAVRRLREGEQFERALDLCERWMKAAVEKNPGAEPRFMDEQLKLLQSLGREREYAQILERLYRFGPADAGASNDLGYTWLELGVNFDRAFALIRYAVARDPLNAAFLDSLAWAHYKRGEFGPALKQQARAVRLLAGQDADQYDHLGDIHWRLDDREAAIAAWKKAADLLDKETDAERRRYGRSVVRDRLREKIATADAGGKVQVAATAAELKG